MLHIANIPCLHQHLHTPLCETRAYLKDPGRPQPSTVIASTRVAVWCGLGGFAQEVVGVLSGSELESVTKILITELCSQ